MSAFGPTRLAIARAAFTLLCVSLSLRPSPAQEVQGTSERLPAPPGLDQRGALKKIKKVFKKEYSARSPSERTALARELLRLGKATRDDSVTRFVLFQEARDVAAKVGDVGTSIEACRTIAGIYNVDGIAMKLEVIESVSRARSLVDVPALVVETIHVLDEAFAKLAFQHTKSLEAVARRALRMVRSEWLKYNLEESARNLKLLDEWKKRLEEALPRLVRDPDDPEANLTLGTFLCLVAGSWKEGLPRLARGEDADLRIIAKREISGASSVEERIALGDGWSRLGERRGNSLKEEMRLRAHFWYVEAWKSLSGFGRAELEEKLHLAHWRYLDELEEYDVTVGHGKLGTGGRLGFRAGKTPDELLVATLPSTHGLGMHAVRRGAATVKYQLRKRYSRLRAFAALNDSARPATRLTFHVVGDGETLWKSDKVDRLNRSEFVEVDVQGVDELELRITCPGPYFSAHAAWLDPVLVR